MLHASRKDVMISRLTGTLVQKVPDHCIIEVGGVGYLVKTSLTTFGLLPEIGTELCLDILTYVREDQISLFGFFTSKEKILFQRLIAISGVGPKMALAILSGLPVEALARAIGSGDHARLSAIPGVGRKTADRIIVELRDRIGKIIGNTGENFAATENSIIEDAISALVNLGYKRQVAESILIQTKPSDSMRIEDVIRSALQELNRA